MRKIFKIKNKNKSVIRDPNNVSEKLSMANCNKKIVAEQSLPEVA